MKQKKSNQKNEVDKMRNINRSNVKKGKKKDRLCIKSYGSNESKTENI